MTDTIRKFYLFIQLFISNEIWISQYFPRTDYIYITTVTSFWKHSRYLNIYRIFRHIQTINYLSWGKFSFEIINTSKAAN